MRTFVFPLIIFFFSLNGFAKNRVVYFGGGTSKEVGDKAFNSGFKSAIELSKKADWEGDFYFRNSLPKKISSDDASRVKEFSESNFNNKLNKMLDETKPGEQLLVVLATHGDKQNGKFIVQSDSGNFDVDRLQDFIAAAEAKGIKLGIIGGACFSGSLLKYKTKNTCIISNAPHDKVGVTQDTANILKDLASDRSGTNLEEVYLRNRVGNAGKNYATMPMISTAAGTAVDEMLYPLKSSITRKYDLPYFLTRPVCTNTELAMSTLQEHIGENADIGSAIFGDESKLSYSKLKEKTIAYDKQFAEAKDVVLLANSNSCADIKGQRVCMTLGAIDNFMRKRGEFATSSPESAKVFGELAKSADYKQYSVVRKAWDSQLVALEEKSFEISKSERHLYDQLYKKMSEDPKIKSAPNPCRDFKL